MAQRLIITARADAPRDLLFEVPTGTPAGPDFGRWTGRSLYEVGDVEPEALGAWLSDPNAVSHGGESLAAMIVRLARWLELVPDGRTHLECPPLVARGLVVAALAAPAELIFRIDVAPGGEVSLSRSGDHWRLQSLVRSVGRPAPVAEPAADRNRPPRRSP